MAETKGFECGECGSEFSTERGLETHKGIKHDPLPKDKATNLYVRENLSAFEIAERLNMSHRAVKTRLSKYELWGKCPTKYSLRCSQGYPVITATGVEDSKRVRVHRLLAIATGYDPHDVFGGDYDVDHVNNCKIDNRVENLQLLNKKDHGAKHADQGPKNQYDS
jgi:hypothetical protein